MKAIPLNQKAVLIEFSSHCPKFSRKDKAESADVADRNNAKKNRVAVVKNLLDANESSFKTMSSALKACENANRSMTVPWGDDKRRLIPVTNLTKYVETMSNLVDTANEKKKAFIANFQNVVRESVTDLGNLGQADEFPDEDELNSLYGVTYKISPLPTGADIRTALADCEAQALVDDLAAEYEIKNAQKLKGVEAEVFTRVYDSVERMVVQLSNPNGKVFDTLFSNVQDLVNMLPGLNLTDNPDLTRLTKEIETKLLGQVDAATRLRDRKRSQALRSSLASDAADILDEVKGHLMEYSSEDMTRKWDIACDLAINDLMGLPCPVGIPAEGKSSVDIQYAGQASLEVQKTLLPMLERDTVDVSDFFNDFDGFQEFKHEG